MGREKRFAARIWGGFTIEIFNTSKVTWIALILCVGCIIVIFTAGIPVVAAVCLRILLVSFALFSFHTGYRKESICFYVVCLSVTIPLTAISIYNIATYVKGIRAPFGYVIVGMNVVVFLAAQIVRQIGLIVRKGHLKDSSIKLRSSVICITICAVLLPVAFAFTVIAALGENFQSIPHP
jgi:hypothetical protein